MVDLLARLQRDRPTRSEARRLVKADKPRATKGRPRSFVYRFQPHDKAFRLTMQFRKGHVSREEIARALVEVADELRSN